MWAKLVGPEAIWGVRAGETGGLRRPGRTASTWNGARGTFCFWLCLVSRGDQVLTPETNFSSTANVCSELVAMEM